MEHEHSTEQQQPKEQKTTENKPKKRGGGGRKLVPDDAVITVHKLDNPKKQGSKAHALYEKYLEAHRQGRKMTFAEAVEASGGKRDIVTWDLRNGWISVDKCSNWDALGPKAEALRDKLHGSSPASTMSEPEPAVPDDDDELVEDDEIDPTEDDEDEDED